MKRSTRWCAGGALALLLVGGAGYVAVRASRGDAALPSWIASLVGAGGPRPVDAGLFCREHGVPEKFCTLCHEELKDRLRPCPEHGLPEDICTICRPDAAVMYGLTPLCREHGLPSYFCTRCDASRVGGEVETGWCPTHWVPAAVCLRCRSELEREITLCAEHRAPAILCVACDPELERNFDACDRHRLPRSYCGDLACAAASRPLTAEAKEVSESTLPLVRLAGPEVARNAGLSLETVAARTTSPSVEATGEVTYDATRFARVRSPLPGVVREARAVEGTAVRRGDVLAVVDSASFGEAKADYLAAAPAVELWEKTLDRLTGLRRDQLVPGKEIVQAEAELARARADLARSRQRLRIWGLDDAALSALGEEKEETRNRVEVASPIDGTVVGRRVAEGELIDGLAELFTVADVGHLWVHLAIPESDLSRVRASQPFEFVVDSLAPSRFGGVVTWIEPEIDVRTRTARVRGTVENAGGSLRVNMFGTARIAVGEGRSSLSVPRQSIQWDGRSFVVFRRAEEGVFEPHRVLIGATRDGRVDLVWSDLAAGDSVVGTGSFLLKTEIQKGSIGAGCCGE